MWTMQNGEVCVLFIKCHVVAGTDIIKYDVEWHLVMKIHPLKCKLVNCPFEVWVLKPTFVPLPLPHFFWWEGQMFLMDFENNRSQGYSFHTHSFLLFHFTFCFLMRLTFILLSPNVWDFIISLLIFEVTAVFLTIHHTFPLEGEEKKKQPLSISYSNRFFVSWLWYLSMKFTISHHFLCTCDESQSLWRRGSMLSDSPVCGH